jgi:serine/threonine-protein kinase
LDDDGSPIIVLKRIEGVAWRAIMDDAAAVRERGGADLLEYNLRVLIQLSNAVSYAHARGIIHRDLKPANVMTGRFGEVYLVDWGIAVSLRDDPTGRLPVASQANTIAGTPAYMAPEMIWAAGGLSERTDVYLLGAILHKILTGAPPHRGTFKEILASILWSRPVYEPTVPNELADIARRAMSPRDEHRYASADEMRLRLEWYLRHRAALALSRTAEGCLAELRALIAADPVDEAVRDRLYRLFAEARFGFRQAIGACEDNARAHAGLRQAIELMITFELERGTAEAASAALAELERPPPEFAKRVAEALRASRLERERLERLDADLDPAVGRRMRVAVAMALGFVWTVAPQIVAYFERRHPHHAHWMAYVVSASLAVSAAGLVLSGKESLFKTTINRAPVAMAVVFFACQLSLLLGCHLLGVSELQAVVLDQLIAGASLAGYAAMQNRRLWPSACAFLVGFLVAAARPEWRWILLSAGNFVLLVNFASAWWGPHHPFASSGLGGRGELSRAPEANRARPSRSSSEKS